MWQVSNTDFWVIPGKHDDTQGLIWLSLSPSSLLMEDMFCPQRWVFKKSISQSINQHTTASYLSLFLQNQMSEICLCQQRGFIVEKSLTGFISTKADLSRVFILFSEKKHI